MIEITEKNKEFVLQNLNKQRYINLVQIIKQDIQINDENYPLDTNNEWSRINGYGFKMFILEKTADVENAMNILALMYDFPLESEIIINEEKICSVRKLFLNGEQGYIIYILG